MSDDGAVAPDRLDQTAQRHLVSRRQRVRRRLGGGFWVTAILVMAALVVATALTQRSGVESALEAAAAKRLAERGFGKVQVTVEGRTITAEVPAGTAEDRVERIVSGVPGVVSVETRQTFANPRQAETCASLERELDRATDDQRIPFEGATARLTSRGTALVDAAATVLERCPAGKIIVGGHSDEDTPDFATLSLERARLMTAMLEDSGVSPRRLEARGYGDQFPLSEADTAAAQQQNQRGSISPSAKGP